MITMESAVLITCDVCFEVFNTDEEMEEHSFKVHYENISGLKRALKWADLML